MVGKQSVRLIACAKWDLSVPSNMVCYFLWGGGRRRRVDLLEHGAGTCLRLPLAKETLGKQPRKKKKRRARPLTSVGRRRMINKLKRGAKYRISARTID